MLLHFAGRLTAIDILDTAYDEPQVTSENVCETGLLGSHQCNFDSRQHRFRPSRRVLHKLYALLCRGNLDPSVLTPLPLNAADSCKCRPGFVFLQNLMCGMSVIFN